MKARQQPLSAKRSRKTKERSSGETPGKPEAVANKSRRDKDIPADRGPYEQHSESQGSE